jgi:hypothetical protein
LVRAFTAFFSGCYGIARGDAELALAPSHERSPTVRLPEGGFLERYDIPLLKLILAEAKAEALVEFPRFGRVEVR